ncbi:ABC transporter permease [Aestuariivirga sp.]|uniref:ABC transporter permease n=1 Tax=Aestuariivirga sp. TaxID=2650926 RepID=UPI0039E5B3DC
MTAEALILPAQEAESRPARGGTSSVELLMPITLMFALLIMAVIRSPMLISSAGIGAASIVAAPLILATYALMATVIAGRGTVDLAIGPLISFINVTMIQLVGAGLIGSPISVFIYCILAGIAYQVVMALIVIYVRVQPIIVSLSGYLALSGINLVILPRPGGVAPDFMADWGAGTSVFSPSLAIVVLATVFWLLFKRTAFYTHLRLMGSDERAAFTTGIPITKVRIGAHVISGIFAALASICFTSLISSGDPGQGTTYTLTAVTALVLGGASLGGGRAGVMGSLLGAINIYLISYCLSTFNFGTVQSFVTQLSYGAILVISLLMTLILPFIQRHVHKFSALLYFVVLAVGAFGVILHATYNYAALKLASGPAPKLFTPVDLGFAAGGHASLLTYWLSAAFVGVTIPLLLRILVQRSGKSDISPAIYVVVIALILLVAYAISHGLMGAQVKP